MVLQVWLYVPYITLSRDGSHNLSAVILIYHIFSEFLFGYSYVMVNVFLEKEICAKWNKQPGIVYNINQSQNVFIHMMKIHGNFSICLLKVEFLGNFVNEYIKKKKDNFRSIKIHAAMRLYKMSSTMSYTTRTSFQLYKDQSTCCTCEQN